MVQSEAAWKAEMDAQSLIDAAAIRKDKKRFTAAKGGLKKLAARKVKESKRAALEADVATKLKKCFK